MINQSVVENIRKYGVFKDSGEARRDLLEGIGFRMDKPAEYVIISGCLQPETMPHVFHALKELLVHLDVDYTLLSKEYCCGWMPIGQPAAMMKHEEDINTFKELSKSFITENVKQAEVLGAKSIALFCAACEPNYSNLQDTASVEFISCSELLDRHFESGSLSMEVDFYPGCYRFRRRITDIPLNTESATRLLRKIEGLQVNHVDTKLCCYIPPNLEQLVGALKTEQLVTVCTGCYQNLKGQLGNGGKHSVKMLPELLLPSLKVSHV